MRAMLVLLLVGCTPDIPSGAYLCGPNASCPDGQACDGATHSCVSPVSVMPFACTGQVRDAGTVATATPIPNLGCVSAVTPLDGCFDTPADTIDWFSFSTPPECTAVGIEARVAFPVAYEPLEVEVFDATGTTSLGTDADCVSNSGDAARCLKATLVPGNSYTLAIKPTGEDNCDGSCAFNSYLLNVQLVTP